MNDQQIDSFSRGIAGEPPATGSDDAPWRLGAQLRDAVTARESDLDASERAQFSLDQPNMKALQAQVHRRLAHGVGDAEAPTAVARPTAPGPRRVGPAGGMAGVLDAVFGSAWGRGAMVLALVGMGAALVIQGPPRGDAPDPAIVLRSADPPATLRTAGPAALTRALEKRLASLGASVTTVERSPGHWVLEVIAEDATQMATVQAVLDEYGLPKFDGTKASVTILSLDGEPLRRRP